MFGQPHSTLPGPCEFDFLRDVIVSNMMLTRAEVYTGLVSMEPKARPQVEVMFTPIPRSGEKDTLRAGTRGGGGVLVAPTCSQYTPSCSSPSLPTGPYAHLVSGAFGDRGASPAPFYPEPPALIGLG